jgi:hypothetical protein
MPIELEEQFVSTNAPVIKRTRIGERALIGLIDEPQQRPVQKVDDVTKQLVTVINPRTGRPKQELVVHGIVYPGNTAPVGRKEEQWVPAEWEVVRMILRGGGFGDWIEARKTHRNGGRLVIGDIIQQIVDHAQAYDAQGAPTGSKITDQSMVDALPRGRSVGFYGPLTLHIPSDPTWVARAEAAYRERHAISVGQSAVTEAPF